MDDNRSAPVSPSRRRFLAGAAGAAALAFGAGFIPARVLARGASEAAWRGLAERIAGGVLRPGDVGFESLARPFNLHYADRLPAGIARCRSAEDVSAAIGWARENEVPFTARSGGHSYAGYSTTTGLMISLSAMNATSFDPATGIATIGGGARNGNIYAALQRSGVTITHGRCPTVGAAGFLLGGGIGFNMRLLGVASDKLVSTEIVTADGEIRSASATASPDLFWACRGGGGGNFGINTGFRMTTVPAEPRTVFILRWPSGSEALFAVLLAALEAAPPTLGSRVGLAALPGQSGVAVSLIGQIAGSADEARAILAPVLRFPSPREEEVKTVDYWAAQSLLLDRDAPFAFQERSRFVRQPLGEDAAATAFDWMRRWPGTSRGGFLVLFQTGGRINDIAADATAFVHRDSRWLLDVATAWSDDDDAATLTQARSWQDGFYSAMRRFADGGAYQNFIDPALDDWQTAYYGTNLPRLRRIKAEVDPDGVFAFPQSIPPR